MSLTVEQLYQQIGRAATSLADDLAGKLLIYAEIEDGVISSDVFYVNQVGVVRFRLSPKPMRELIYSFWRQWKEQPGNRVWRTMAYVIDGKKFSIDLTYSDQINLDEDVAERRPAIVRKYFGDVAVDYSTSR